VEHVQRIRFGERTEHASDRRGDLHLAEQPHCVDLRPTRTLVVVQDLQQRRHGVGAQRQDLPPRAAG
jgi:hypothetical protein